MIKKHKNYEAYKGCIVPKFSDIMINQLAKHSDRGVSWREDEPDLLLVRAKEELKEVEDAIKKLNTSVNTEHYKELSKSVAKECADVANFMMMIADSVEAI